MPRDWDAFYQKAREDRPPAFVVRAYGPFVPKGPVLDLAGGLGRNARYFLQRGHPVVLVEGSQEALRRLSGTPGLALVGLELLGATGPLADAEVLKASGLPESASTSPPSPTSPFQPQRA